MKIISNFFKRIFSDKYTLSIFLLIVFHTVFFIVFRILNKNYQTWDSAGHINLSYRIADEIKRLISGEEGASIVSILQMSNYYPPFVQITGAIVSLIFGYKSVFLLIETLIFFILSIIFTYKLTFLLTKNEKISFLTATIYSLFPQVIDQSHYFHLDIPLTALVLMSVYFLFISDNFKKLWPTIIFFICLSFIQLTKWTGFIFLIVPVLVALHGAFINHGKTNDRKYSLQIIKNLLIASVIFLILTIPWYYVNWKELLVQVKVFSVGESDDPQSLWESLIYYPVNAISHQIMFLPFLLVFVSLINQFKNNKKNGFIILLSILVPWLFFVFISNKNLRYTLPLTPVLAYLISDILTSISNNKKVKLRGFTTFTLIYLVSASLFLSFFRLNRESSVLKPISIVFTGPRYKSWYHYGTSFYAYKPDKYPSDEILDFIYEDADKANEPLGVAVLVDSEQISAATLEMLRLENHYNNMYMPVPYFQFEKFRSDEEVEAFFVETSSQYVISPSYIGPTGLRNYEVLEQCVGYLKSERNKLFEKIKIFDLPNDEKISVYKKIGSVKKEAALDGCRIGAGIDDGIESIKLSPNYTYLFFTGHFAIQDKIWKDYEKGVMYIVQIENTIHESYLDIHNLPKSGSSFCSLDGLNLDVSEDIKRVLTSDNQCGEGIPCSKVVLVRWSVGDQEVKVSEFTKESL